MVFYFGVNEIVLIYEGMMRLYLFFLMGIVTPCVMAHMNYQVLVSFSMPQKLLEETVRDATRHHMPVILNGLYHDSMHETAVKIFELSKKIPNLSMQIDPTAFQRYSITQVPAWVANNQKTFDVVFGNITCEHALDELTRLGDSSKSAL
jgi:conjugal transfer pilus assembly protein TrbC